jgi:hypothetical protein
MKVCILIILSPIFSEYFTTRCLLSIENCFIPVLYIEGSDNPKLEQTFVEKENWWPSQQPSLLHWPEIFPISNSASFLSPHLD